MLPPCADRRPYTGEADSLSWWPHDNLHIHYALDMWPLIAIEYVFHVSLMVCGAILAYAFYCLSTARG